MGKLYDLVEFRNYLVDQLDNLSLDKSIKEKIEFIEKTKRVFSRQTSYCDSILKDLMLLGEKNQELIDKLQQKISDIDSELDTLSESNFKNDEYRKKFNEQNLQGPDFQNSLIISVELESIIKSKITEYSDWHYPALQINPRSKKWIDPMVAGDPLYLTHYDINLIKEIISGYPDLYQNRLRLYQIVDRDFSDLPLAQFSFVLCWDYFNYLSFDFVEKYIREVWKLLRPGGRFMFSYTNCDISGPALRAESLACGYACSRWIQKLCTEIGYDINELQDFETDDAFNTHVSWAILKKPGNLSTIKASQAIAEIVIK